MRTVSNSGKEVSAISHRAHTFFQPKLTINAPGDKYEQEADAMADKVMRMPENSASISPAINLSLVQCKCAACEEEELQKKEKEENESQVPELQRKCAACEDEDNTVQRKSNMQAHAASGQLSSEIQSSKGSGSPLHADALSSMSNAFRKDFSSVRIHHDSRASAMNQSIQAKAFTHGSDIYFNHNQYNPGSTEGKRLLAHELTHVVQQGGASGNVQRSLTVEPTYPTYLTNDLPNRNPARDPASRLTAAQRIGHVQSLLNRLCPDFQVDGSTGIVTPLDPTRNEAAIADADNPTVCCCLQILTRPSATGNWRILVSDVVGPHTLDSANVVVIPGPNAPMTYGHWTGGPSQQPVLMATEIVLGHELCGHAALMELSAHPPHTGRLISNEHDPTVNIQNQIATDQGIPQSDLRGLAAGGSHRGESFAKIVISGYPINRISPFSIPDRTQIDKLNLATRLVQTNDSYVDIVGHTDTSGTEAINDRVSLDRANVVKGYIANRVRNTRHLDRHDSSTPLVNRFRSATGVRNTQPPPSPLDANPDNWRRVEIFLAGYPAGSSNPPINTPTQVNPITPPPRANILAGSGDACEKKLITTAYTGITPATPAVAPKLEDTVLSDPTEKTCNHCSVDIQPSAPESIQRKERHMSTMKDRLTRTASDPVITNENVHDVLALLDVMNPVDFSDTIMAMESLGYIDTLFDQVGEDDKQNFAPLLRRIQLNRIQTLKDKSQIVDSCEPKKRSKLNETVADTKVWGRQCFVAVNGYVFDMEFGNMPDPKVADALERHFFHQAINGQLPEYRKINYAQQIADRFRLVETQPQNFAHVCTQPFDPLCAALAMAYVDRTDLTVNYCDSFFQHSKEERLRAMFHELVHVHASVEDTGYGDERLYQYLEPVDAVNNASSYENFAVQVLSPKKLSVSQPSGDVIDDCTPPQKSVVKKRMAFGARMIKNSLNMIGDASHVVGANLIANFFKTRDRSEVTRIIERFKETNDAFNLPIHIECETSCDKSDVGYNRYPGTFVHLCPDFFSLGEDRQVQLLLLLIMDRKTGGKMGSEPGTAAFSGQDKDSAYKNLWTYVAYAMAVSDLFPHWRIVNAEFRYEREIVNAFEDLSRHLLPNITEELNIRKTIDITYIADLRKTLITTLTNSVVNSEALYKASSKDYISKLNDLMKVAQMVSDNFLKFSGEAFLKQILVDADSANAAKIITDRMEDRLRDELITELYGHYQNIRASVPVDFAVALNNMTTLSKKYIGNLKQLDSYIPFVKEVIGIDAPVEAYMQQLKAKLPASKHQEWEKSYYDMKVAIIGFDQMDMYNATTDEIMAGKSFNKKSKPGDPAAVIKKFKKELDDDFKILKAKK